MIGITSIRIARRTVGHIDLLTYTVSTHVLFARFSRFRAIINRLALGRVERIEALERKKTGWIFSLKPAVIPAGPSVTIGIPTATLGTLTNRRNTVLAVIENIAFAAPLKTNEPTGIVKADGIDAGVPILTGAALITALVRATLFPLARTGQTDTLLTKLTFPARSARIATSVRPATLTIAGPFAALARA